MSEKSSFEPKEHPIQLTFVGVKDLRFRADVPPATIKPDQLGELRFSFSRSDYDTEARTIQLNVRMECGNEKGPCEVAVELVGLFTVNAEAQIPCEKVLEWADKAAFYTIFPYLREHVFALTTRVGMEPLMMPLLAVPTMNFSKEA